MDHRLRKLISFFILVLSSSLNSGSVLFGRDDTFRSVKTSSTGDSSHLPESVYAFRSENASVQENCTDRSINDFPKDLFTYEQRKHGAVLLHTIFGLYCFVLTALVCNDYLLPAMDLICADLKISMDVAGATFLATASCFPELFVNVVGTFLTESDLGVGAVLGGAVFNTFATPACGALSAAQGIQLDWSILSRDCVIYIMSVSVLAVIMWDGLVTWYESMILMIMFTSYFTLLFFNERLIRWANKLIATFSKRSQLNDTRREPPPEDKTDPMPFGTYRPYFHGELMIEYRNSISKAGGKIPNGTARPDEHLEKLEYVEPSTPFTWPGGSTSANAWFLFIWPLKFILFITVPDSRFKRLRNWYPVTFVMCVTWIAITSYLTSWMMTVVGDTLNISDSIMGITILSAGGNMPELVTIVTLARQGHGDMAMSNTLGANTLDILMCLGLPWLIKCIMSGQDIEIVSGALAYSILSILVCVVGFYLVTAFFKFKMNKKVGFACLFMYTTFLVFAVMVESNVFFFVNLPMCDR
ncbi:sodium/potassium/calcium exchanger 3 [Orussus abietinus]|uniref:sodium/potassium/calcium exchanger 3 n=1 Tax=Orussus abietinus TaxID=222816 RepID=UPI0006265331|nr:sodium/potassium/calcium exchanger 3 [Orussus abietinus]